MPPGPITKSDGLFILRVLDKRQTHSPACCKSNASINATTFKTYRPEKKYFSCFATIFKNARTTIQSINKKKVVTKQYY